MSRLGAVDPFAIQLVRGECESCGTPATLVWEDSRRCSSCQLHAARLAARQKHRRHR